ncbi:MAG: S8 family serine peptidase [Gemmatimonadota bacterium]
MVAVSGATTDPCVGELVTIDRWGSSGCNDGPSGNVNYTTTFSGTSAAAPQVAAAAALILSREPNLTESQVRARLCQTADPWGAASEFGCGKLNVLRALTGTQLTSSIGGPAVVNSNATCLWSASASGGIPPYTYTWKVNGQTVGSGVDIYYTNSGSPFTLSLTVADSFQPTPHSSVASTSVTISGSAPPCQF